MSRAVANTNVLLPETLDFNIGARAVTVVVDTPTRLVLSFGTDDEDGIFGVEIIGRGLSFADPFPGEVTLVRALAGDLTTTFITYDQLPPAFPLVALARAPSTDPLRFGFAVVEIFQGPNEVVGGPTRDDVGALDEADTISGLGGDDDLRGGDGDDILAGGAGDDELRGGNGNDTLSGGDGDDLLDGGRGTNQLVGGAGDDRFLALEPGPGVTLQIQIVTGGEGVDRLVLNQPSLLGVGAPRELDYTDFRLDGQQMLLFAGGSRVTYSGIEGLVVYGGGAADGIEGSDGLDELQGGAGDDELSGGNGDDRLMGEAGFDKINGGDGFDVVVIGTEFGEAPTNGGFIDLSTEEPNFFNDGYGWDRYFNIEGAVGGDLQDIFLGGDQANRFNGGGGSDILYGRGGADVIDGDFGADFILGGAGDDLLIGDEGDDFLFAGGDYVFNAASAGNDQIYAGGGNDFAVGGDGADRIEGEAGDDILYGGAGADTIGGGDGNDFLLGEDGADTLSGGRGINYLFGGAGNDNFRVVAGEAGRSFVFDWAAGDKLVLSGFAFSITQAAFNMLRFENGSTVFQGPGGEAITIVGAHLTAQDIILTM